MTSTAPTLFAGFAPAKSPEIAIVVSSNTAARSFARPSPSPCKWRASTEVASNRRAARRARRAREGRSRGEQEAIDDGNRTTFSCARDSTALFISAALVAVIGIVNLYSATSVYSGARAEKYVNPGVLDGGGGILAVSRRRSITATSSGSATSSTSPASFGWSSCSSWGGTSAARRGGSFSAAPVSAERIHEVALAIALANFLHDDPRGEGTTLKDHGRAGVLSP